MLSVSWAFAENTPHAFSDGGPLRSIDDPSFTLEKSKAIRREFNPRFADWTVGGDLSRYVYLNASEFWPHIILAEDSRTRPLVTQAGDKLTEFVLRLGKEKSKLANYVIDSPIDGVIVVSNNRIVFESYPRMSSTDKHLWFSISKTFVSTAVAILEDRGEIDSAQPIDSYLSVLKDTAWSGIRIIDILDMASGIDCPEVKEDQDSCFWRFYGAFGWPETGKFQDDPMATVASMRRRRTAGEAFDYTSVNTEVLAQLVETVSGERFSEFVEREIWRRVQSESDALLTTTKNGAAFTAGGVSSRLRDLARYGMLFTDAVRSKSKPVISDAYMKKIQVSGRPKLTFESSDTWPRNALSDKSFRHNSYQWDIVTSDGHIYKSGFGGQGLYIAPRDNLVVAWFGTEDGPGEIEMLEVARQLATSESFRP